MNKDQLIKSILQLMELSSMADDEKSMWTIFVPSMEENELTKLKTVLEKEVNQLTDIYLNVLKTSAKK